jgi:hypothetical protein
MFDVHLSKQLSSYGANQLNSRIISRVGVAYLAYDFNPICIAVTPRQFFTSTPALADEIRNISGRETDGLFAGVDFYRGTFRYNFQQF